MDVCKYCGVVLKNSRCPRIVQACRNCRHKYYREVGGKSVQHKINERQRDNYDRQRQAKWFQKWKLANPDLYKARHNRSNRSIAGRYNRAKTRAIRHERTWEVSKEQFEVFLSLPCFYCNGSLNDTGCGVDRKNSDLGYTVENLVPCCGICNKIKSNLLTCEEMMVAMKAVLEWRTSQRR